MPGCQCHLNECGASVIIGTLMLILVVVIGVTGIALMMSTAQKEEMKRQSHQNAVKNEKLDIERIELLPNATTPNQWAFINFSIVNSDIKDATVTIIGLYDQSNRTFRYPLAVTAGTSANTMTLYTLTSEGSFPRYADPSGSLLRIPGKKSLGVSVNLSDFTDPGLSLNNGDEVRIILYTLLLNNFEKRFIPPTPMVRVSVETEDIGVKRDFVVLDGSGSTDDGSIVEYRWDVWFNRTGYPYAPKIGKNVIFKPDSNQGLNVTLTVTDNTGMQTTSDRIIVPADHQFFPPVRIDITTNGLQVNATVLDLNGNGVPDIAVNFIGTNVTFSSSPYSQTDCYGNALTSVSIGGGTIKAIAMDYNLQSPTKTI